jgi:hypothetical protein
VSDTPIYQRLADEHLIDIPESRPDDAPALAMLGPVRYGEHVDFPWPPPAEPPARTAGQQDHTDPWAYAGPDADPPGAP